MKRHNDEGQPRQNDVNRTSQDGSHSDLNIHSSFPGKKAPMDTDNHPERRVPITEFRHGAPSGPTVEVPTPSKTDKNKKMPQKPFRGANS